MNIYTNPNSSFPSQVVPDEEKSTQEYGLAVARAIEGEWWAGDRGIGAGGRFGTNWQYFNTLRLYSRGLHSDTATWLHSWSDIHGRVHNS